MVLTELKPDKNKIVSVHVSSAFKIFLCFITFASIIYFIFVERDVMRALFLLNIIANYRVMLAFLTDWSEEIIFKTPVLSNDAHGITSERKLSDVLNNNFISSYNAFTPNVDNNNSNNSNNSNDNDNNNNIVNSFYDNKINYNFNENTDNFAWWSDY